MVGMPRSRTCGRSPTRDHECNVERHRDSRERLVLTRSRSRVATSGQGYLTEVLGIVEIDADEQIAAVVMFDLEDFDAAIAELDARYLAGEAAAHAHTWSVVAGGYAALNRHELPATTPDWVNIDHRRETAFGPGDLIAYLRAGLDLDQNINIYVETVHRLTDLGAVVTYAAHETSQEGFDAEWRGIAVFTVEGEMINRSEVFDEADLDAAIARFEELQPAGTAAGKHGKPGGRALSCVLHRPRLGRHGRDAGRRLFHRRSAAGSERRDPARSRCRDRSMRRQTPMSGSECEIEASSRPAASASPSHYPRFGPIDGPRRSTSRSSQSSRSTPTSESRRSSCSTSTTSTPPSRSSTPDTLAGEAAAHSETWSVIAEVYAALNRGEIPATAPDLVDIDHRSLAAIGSGDLMAYLQRRVGRCATEQHLY